MMALSRSHSGCPSGQRLGVGHIQRRPADGPRAQRIDQRTGIDMPAARDVHQPGVRPHRGQFRRADDVLGFRGQRQRHEHHPRSRQGLRQLAGLQGADRPWHRGALPADHRDLRAHRRQQLHQRGRDTAAAHDRDRLVIQALPRRRAPGRGPDTAAQQPQPGQGQHQRVLGDRLGVGALGAGPGPRRVQQAGPGGQFHPRERQLHPPRRRRRRQSPGQPVEVGRIQPDQRVSVRADPGRLTAGLPHRRGDPVPGPRPDGNTR